MISRENSYHKGSHESLSFEVSHVLLFASKTWLDQLVYLRIELREIFTIPQNKMAGAKFTLVVMATRWLTGFLEPRLLARKPIVVISTESI